MSPSLDDERAREYTEALEGRLVDALDGDAGVSRRAVLGSLGLAGSAALMGAGSADDGHGGGESGHGGSESEHANFGARGEFDEGNLDPHEFLRTFNTGFDGQDNLKRDVFEEDGERVRYFELTAVDATIEVAPGVEFSAWAYQGQVPGPSAVTARSPASGRPSTPGRSCSARCSCT
ncbi:MAG: hypothetical protein ABEJ05_10520 [Haloglomus sp.]